MSIALAFVSVFCAGGIFAYARELLRLQRLLSNGQVRRATITHLEKIDGGSESVIHFLVGYEYLDDAGRPARDEQDVNSSVYFDSLCVGQTIEVLRTANTSYPASQVARDRRIAIAILAALLPFWGAMAWVLW